MATVKLYQSTDIYSIAIGDFQYSELSPGESTYITAVYDTEGSALRYEINEILFPIATLKYWERNGLDRQGLETILSGDDSIHLLTGPAAQNVIDTGAGYDTIHFASGFLSSAFTRFVGGVTVEGPEGVSEIVHAERMLFSDGEVNVSSAGLGTAGLIDALFYLHENPDVWTTGVHPAEHYLVKGWQDGRDPNHFFSTSGYLAANPDVATSGINPLDHYHEFGWKEGRDPSIDFDTTLYLRNNPDVQAAGMDPLAHYLTYGFDEGRTAHAAVGTSIQNNFDTEFYLLANPEVASANINPYEHYLQFGWREGRDPNAYFDASTYLRDNPDVAEAGVDPLTHYHEYGWREGRAPSALFDTAKYLAAYADVADAAVDPLAHFLQFGVYEGRHPLGEIL
jgi:serralysin